MIQRTKEKEQDMRGLLLVIMIALASTNIYADDKKKKDTAAKKKAADDKKAADAKAKAAKKETTAKKSFQAEDKPLDLIFHA